MTRAARWGVLLFAALLLVALGAGGSALPDALSLERVAGLPRWSLLLAVALATLVSEDLACLATGLLVAAGAVEFVPGTLACLVGITAGDIALMLTGRALGPAALRRAPLRWLLREDDVARGRAFFTRHGGKAILAARFAPGLRLPTYVAAGLCGMPLLRFAGWFTLGAILWTPLLVGAATILGRGAVDVFAHYRGAALPLLIVVLLLVSAVPRLLPRVLAWARPRAAAVAASATARRALGAWRRWTKWEFWPLWLFYPPVIAYIVWQAVVRGRSTSFSAVNPAIDAGGLIGESKSAILGGLAGAGERVARWFLLPPGGTPAARTRAVLDGLAARTLGLPAVLKPDAGHRGLGVAVCRTAEDVARHVAAWPVPLIVQEYVPGAEFGVFWARHPDEPRGRVLSITRKEMPVLVGDGIRTLEELILADERAVVLARTYLAANAARRGSVPAAGERVQLVELGTHCRGAIFLDGSDLLTPALADAIDRVAATFSGFHFGRFDVRAPSVEAFREGEFRVIELNGLTSEQTHIYDPRNSLLDAYRTLFAQWRLAFEIGAVNQARGHGTVSPFGLLRRTLAFRTAARTLREPA